MMAASRRVAQRIRDSVDRLMLALDSETVTSFQLGIYYPFIMVAGFYLLLIADEPTIALLDTLGPSWIYYGWLGLNIVCPAMTILGRRLYSKAAHGNEPNSAYGGAWLQLVGDAGVWGAICIYAMCWVNVSYLGQPLYPTFYFLMGVPGGAAFTLRSVRRLRQIKRRERRL